MMKNSRPAIRELRVRAVRVPMPEPHQTASGVITESPLVLTDVTTDQGVSGHSLESLTLESRCIQVKFLPS
jgi:mandelate racemase